MYVFSHYQLCTDNYNYVLCYVLRCVFQVFTLPFVVLHCVSFKFCIRFYVMFCICFMPKFYNAYMVRFTLCFMLCFALHFMLSFTFSFVLSNALSFLINVLLCLLRFTLYYVEFYNILLDILLLLHFTCVIIYIQISVTSLLSYDENLFYNLCYPNIQHFITCTLLLYCIT